VTTALVLTVRETSAGFEQIPPFRFVMSGSLGLLAVKLLAGLATVPVNVPAYRQ
jgi:hypothetical protein